MEITEIKIFPVDEDQLRAFASITIDDALVIRNLKVIKGQKGYFIGMPTKKTGPRKYLEIVYTINAETREMIEEQILAAYEKISGESVKRRVLK